MGTSSANALEARFVGLSVLVSVLVAAALLAVIVLAFVTDVLAARERVRVERMDPGGFRGSRAP
jgi:hypothetical protein